VRISCLKDGTANVSATKSRLDLPWLFTFNIRGIPIARRSLIQREILVRECGVRAQSSSWKALDKRSLKSAKTHVRKRVGLYILSSSQPTFLTRYLPVALLFERSMVIEYGSMRSYAHQACSNLGRDCMPERRGLYRTG